MTDETGIDQSVAEAQPAPMPLPVPGAAGAAPRKKVWPWVVAGVILFILIIGCAGAVWLADEVFNQFEDGLLGPELGGSVGMDTVAWAGSGRFVVTQHYEGFVEPSVVVWDKETGETRTLDGYRLLFCEPEAPVIWMEPVTEEEALMSDSMDGLGDMFDHKPERLVAWRLDDGSEPTDDVSAKWGAWPGPADTIAYLEINPLKGAAPSAVLFNNSAGQGEGVKAKIPDDVITFVPVGWSPSGDYFAVEELRREDPTGDSSDDDRPRKVLVLDVATGDVASALELSAYAPAAPGVVWDGVTDMLFALELNIPDEPEMQSSARLYSAKPGDSAWADAFDSSGWDKPPAFGNAYQAGILGADPDGPLFWVDGRILQLTVDGLIDRGGADSVSAAWYPGSGLIGIEWGFSEGPVSEEWTELVLMDIHGGGRKTVWKSEAVSFSEDF